MKIGVIGCGNMGEVLIKGILSAGISSSKNLYATDISQDKLKRIKRAYKVNICKDAKELVRHAQFILLAVKPQQMRELLLNIQGECKDKLFISIAAGIKTAYIEKLLGERPRVIRVMPNTPLLVGEGMSCIAKGRYAKGEDLKIARRIFGALGDIIVVKERMLDAVTAVSGSGPAYFFYFIEALLDAGYSCGLDDKATRRLVYQTAKGALKLLLTSNKTPAELRAAVTSKGGTTEAALKILEEGKFKEMMKRAVMKAKARSEELSR